MFDQIQLLKPKKLATIGACIFLFSQTLPANAANTGGRAGGSLFNQDQPAPATVNDNYEPAPSNIPTYSAPSYDAFESTSDSSDQIAALKQKVSTLRTQVTSKDNEISSLQVQLSAKTAALATSNASNTELQSSITTLQSQLNKAKTERDNAQKELNSYLSGAVDPQQVANARAQEVAAQQEITKREMSIQEQETIRTNRVQQSIDTAEANRHEEKINEQKIRQTQESAQEQIALNQNRLLIETIRTKYTSIVDQAYPGHNIASNPDVQNILFDAANTTFNWDTDEVKEWRGNSESVIYQLPIAPDEYQDYIYLQVFKSETLIIHDIDRENNPTQKDLYKDIENQYYSEGNKIPGFIFSLGWIVLLTLTGGIAEAKYKPISRLANRLSSRA